MKEEVSPVLINRTDYSNNPKRANSFFHPVVQPKLQINQSNDVFEREADSIAENLFLSSPGQEAVFQPSPTVIQTKTAYTSGTGVAAPDSVQDVFNSRGRRLDNSISTLMQTRLGQDFSNVQVHNDSSAHASAEEIGALAYTYQNHIVFGAGQYQPETKGGQRLIAHELTHVVQQTGGGAPATPAVMRKDAPNNEFDSCNVNQQSLIGPALTDAARAVRLASSVVGSAIGQPDKISPTHRRLLMENFHTTDRGDLKIILGKYMSLGRAFDAGIETKCETSCPKVKGGGAWAGYALNSQVWGGDGPVHLCFDKTGFDFAKANQNIRIGLIIHESAHRYTGVDDVAYAGFPKNTKYPTLSPDDAMNNADSYSEFAVKL